MRWWRALVVSVARLAHGWSTAWLARLEPASPGADPATPADESPTSDPFTPGPPPEHWLALVRSRAPRRAAAAPRALRGEAPRAHAREAPAARGGREAPAARAVAAAAPRARAEASARVDGGAPGVAATADRTPDAAHSAPSGVTRRADIAARSPHAAAAITAPRTERGSADSATDIILPLRPARRAGAASAAARPAVTRTSPVATATETRASDDAAPPRPQEPQRATTPARNAMGPAAAAPRASAAPDRREGAWYETSARASTAATSAPDVVEPGDIDDRAEPATMSPRTVMDRRPPAIAPAAPSPSSRDRVHDQQREPAARLASPWPALPPRSATPDERRDAATRHDAEDVAASAANDAWPLLPRSRDPDADEGIAVGSARRDDGDRLAREHAGLPWNA